MGRTAGGRKGTLRPSSSASSALTLVAGTNTITTVVTAPDGTTTTTYTVTVTRISILQDFNAKRASVKIDTNGVPTFTFSGVDDEVSPQLAAVVAAAIKAAMEGAKP